jgi:hypothetical protein
VYSIHAFCAGTVWEYDGHLGPPPYDLCLSVYSHYEDSHGFTIIDVGHEVERGGTYRRYGDLHFGAYSFHVRLPTEEELRAQSPFQVRLIEPNPTTDTEDMVVASTAITNTPEVFHVRKSSLLDHSFLSSAVVARRGDSNDTQIVVVLDEESRWFFTGIQLQNAGRRVGIVLDGKLVATPRISAIRDDRRIVIPTKLDPLEATKIANKIEEAIRLAEALNY